MGFVLIVIAKLLFLIVGLVDVPLVMYKSIKEKSYLKSMNRYWFYKSRDLDIYGNYDYQTTWNTLLRTRNGYEFGNRNETISSAIGKNQLKGTLSWFGWIVNIILWIVDYKFWFKGGHSVNSIMEL